MPNKSSSTLGKPSRAVRIKPNELVPEAKRKAIMARAFLLAVRKFIMNTHVLVQPRWSTSSLGDSAETSPIELALLGSHLTGCKASHGRLLAMQFIAQTLHGFVAPRFVTTVVVIALLVAITSLVL